MKIIKKPALPIQTCKICGGVVKIKTKDLVTDWAGETKTCFRCPICWSKNCVKFEGGIADERKDCEGQAE